MIDRTTITIRPISQAYAGQLLSVSHRTGRLAALAEQLEKLAGISEILTAQINRTGLLKRIFKAANELFNPFGKHVEIAAISYHPDPAGPSQVVIIKKHSFNKCRKRWLDFVHQYLADLEARQVISESLVQKFCCHFERGSIETVAIPLFRRGAVCGLIVLGNQNPNLPSGLSSGGKFSGEELVLADQLSHLVSQAMAVVENRKTAL
jgi:hypothetical protein